MKTVKITSGNTKLGKVFNLSLPPQHACASKIPCAAKCYARKAWQQYPETRAAWTNNWEAWQEDNLLYMEQIAQFCATKRVERFRWHVAGDIPSAAYLAGMNLVAKCNPATKFLAFTKRFDLVEQHLATGGDLRDNLQLVFSMWPGLLEFLRTLPGTSHYASNDDLFQRIQSVLPLAWMGPAKATEDLWYNETVDNVSRTEGLECHGHCDECFMCWYMEPGSGVVLHEH